MRLSAWRSAAPRREAMGPKVRAVLEPVLSALGAEADPHVWIAWGEDAAYRYTLLVPTAGGLGVCVVRPTAGPGGARVSAKLVRWPRAQIGDLDVDTQGGHRLATVQVEGTVLRGVDDEADALGRFVQALASAADGRGLPDLDQPRGRRSPARTGARQTARS